MNEGHSEKKSLEQERDESLTPEQIEKYEGSRARYEDKLNPSDAKYLPTYIQVDAIFEKHFRDEIKKRGISISEDDLSKIMHYSTVDESESNGKSFKGKQISRVETIDTNIKADSVLRSGIRPQLLHKRAIGETEIRPFSDAETEEFMKRYPLELGEAFESAQEMTSEDIRKTEEETARTNAKRTIDKL